MTIASRFNSRMAVGPTPSRIASASVALPELDGIHLQLTRQVVHGRLDGKIDADIGVDSFNVLNHANFNNYVGVITSPLFGQANSALDGRQMQFTFQIHF